MVRLHCFALAACVAADDGIKQSGAAPLPPAILAFYGAVQGDTTTVLEFMDEEAYWSHTGQPLAFGKQNIEDLFKKETVRSVITETTTVQYVATEGLDEGHDASSFVVTRRGGSEDHKRDAFVLVEDKIKMVWTTNAHAADPTLPDGKPWYDANKILVSGGDANADEVEGVQTAIEVYFHGFVGHDASAMQRPYHQEHPLFLMDFEPTRRAPGACEVSDDCGTYPYINNFDDLLPTFEAFVTQPSNIQLSREFIPVGTMVHGDFAYISTVSYGCEGNIVTPNGTAPMPNRELFVATRDAAAGWKIRFYMFTFDPDSPISPPVEICDLNHDTPGSVWPDEEGSSVVLV